MKEPMKPTEDDCCGSGCNPCIFDVYEKQLKLYNEYLESGKTTKSVSEDNAITQIEYQQFHVVDNINLCDSHRLIKFERRICDSKIVRWNPGDHLLLKYSSDNKKCTRAYTPLKLQSSEEYDFAIIVKVYPNGLVSNYLNNLKCGDQTLWRGPYGSFKIVPNSFSRIIMIAQGTGIIPLYSIIKSILTNEDDMTRITLHYCCQNEDVILFREDLYSLKLNWNFKYNIFLSNFHNVASYKYQEPIVHSKHNLNDLFSLKPQNNDLFVICGSTQFNNEYDTFLKNEFPKSNVVLL